MAADKQAKIYVAGHRGMVGSAIVRALKQQGHHNFVLLSRSDLELSNHAAVNDFFKQE